MDFLTYCKQLKPEDWSRQINTNWTVRDLVAHMVGWEKAFTEELMKSWETKQAPWFMDPGSWDRYNAKSVQLYQDYTPEQLLSELEKWQRKLKSEINRIGKDNLRQAKIFGWVFEWVLGEDNPKSDEIASHQLYHLKQLQRVMMEAE